MSALAEALLAAQRGTLAAMQRAYLAGIIEDEADVLDTMNRIGCTDAVEQAQFVAALETLRGFGVQIPATNGTAAPKEAKPASDAQWKLIRRLADERGQVAPEGPLTVDPFPKTQQLARGERRYRRKVASSKQWQKIAATKKGNCRVCKRVTTWLPALRTASVTFHHVIPRDFHGDDVADNIVPLCFACHELVTRLAPDACLALCSSLTDAEYAYAIGKLGEGAFERVYRVVLT